VFVLVLVAGALAVGPPRAESSSSCHPEWPVVAHRAGGKAVASSSKPVACATETGYMSSESSIAITNRGTIFYSPANTENTLARSFDDGATWSLVQPQRMEYTNFWNTVDPHVTVDRDTGRVFWAHVTGPLRTTSALVDDSGYPGPPTFFLAFAYGFQVYSSGDEGRTWRTADYRTAPMTDWEKVFVGPAPRDGEKPHGYANVVYVCANSPVEVFGPGRLCYKSLDGAKTFAPAGYVFPSASTPAYCNALSTYVPVVGRDGTIYQPISCSDASYVAVSRDEGTTYTWFEAKGAAPFDGFPGQIFFQVALDATDNLYAVWLADDRLWFMRSATHGSTWTKPAVISGPGLHNITVPALAAGPSGSIGVTYYASRKESDEKLSAYITQTWDALDPQALFYTGALNDPKRPIFTDYGLSGSPRTDFVGGAFDSKGTFWAGVVKQLTAPDSNGRFKTTGYVGRLRAR
jgi:hypothetical protein